MPEKTRRTALLWPVACLGLLAACGKDAPKLPPPAPEVSIVTVQRRDVDISAEYVAQTQSSQAVNIQARVSGFLDKRVYTEGAVVKAGQLLFRMDPKPFQAQLDLSYTVISSPVNGVSSLQRCPTAPTCARRTAS